MADKNYGITLTLRTLGTEGADRMRISVEGVGAALNKIGATAPAGLSKIGPDAAAAKPALDALDASVQAVDTALKDVGAKDASLGKIAPEATAARPAIDALSNDLQKLTAQAGAAEASLAWEALNTRPTSAIRADIDAINRALGTLKQTARAPEDLARASTAAEARVAELRRELQLTSAAGRETALSLSMRTLNLRPAQEIRAEMDAVNAALDRLRQRAGAPEDLARAATAAQTRLAALQAELRGIDGAGNKAASGGLASAAGGLVGLVTAAVAARAALAGVREIIDTGLSRQAINVQMQFAAGDQVKAAQDMAFVRSVAEQLGLELETTARSFAKVSASSKGTQLEGQKTRDIFRAVSSAAAVMRLTTEETDGALLAISQMMSKGTIQAEELRGQLGERLPGAFNIAARAMGLTTAELGKMLDQGQLLSEDFLPKFAAELQKSVNPNLAAAENSTQAQLARLGNRFDEFKARIAASGVLDALDAQLLLLINRLKQAADSGDLQRWAEQIGSAIGQAIDVVGSLITVVEHLSGVFELFAIAAAGKGLLAMAGQFRSITAEATATGTAVVALESKVGGVARAFTSLGALTWSAVPLLAVGMLAAKIVELTGLIAEHSAIVAASAETAKKFAQAQQAIVDANGQWAQVQQLSTEQIAALTTEEKYLYAERLKGAEEYWRARAAQQSQSDPVTETSALTLQLAAQARSYQQAAAQIASALQSRVAHEQSVKGAIATEQAAQLAQIKTGLALQIKEYEEANKALEKVRDDRKSAQQTNKQYIDALLAGGNTQTAQQPATALGVSEAIGAAKKSLSAGNNDAALAQADKAMSMIKEMDKAGTEAKLILAGLAREVAAVDDAARGGQEADAQKRIDTATAAIKTLANAAEAVKSIQVGFDEISAISGVDALRKAIQERLAKNPVIVPVQMAQIGKPAVDTKTVDEVLGIPTQRAFGGVLPGVAPHDRADNMLYWGTPGEWVIQLPAVRHYGQDFLARINAMQIPHHAYGGMLGSVASQVRTAPAVAQGAATAARLVVPGIGEFPIQAAPSVLAQMSKAFKRTALAKGARS